MDADRLQAEVKELQDKVDKLESDRDTFRELYLKALEQVRKLELGLRGQQAERLEPNEAQLTLQVLSTLLDDSEQKDEAEAEPKTQRVREHTRRKHPGRKPLPEDLPRVDIEIVPPEVEKEGRDAFVQIGVEERDTIERRPASMVVVRIIRPKFVRKTQQGKSGAQIRIAPPPQLPIEGGVAGPGLLADTLVRHTTAITCR